MLIELPTEARSQRSLAIQQINHDDLRLLETVEEIVSEFGLDHIYVPPDSGSSAKCLYVEPSRDSESSVTSRMAQPERRQRRPSCLVGRALHASGASLGELSTLEGASADVVIRQVMPGVSEAMRQAMGQLQSVQDNGLPWGEALMALYRNLTDWGAMYVARRRSAVGTFEPHEGNDYYPPVSL